MKVGAATLASALTIGALAALGADPASAASERMYLHCEAGDLAGRTLGRSNGSSWRDVDDGTVYTTRSVRISSESEGVVHEKHYGRKSGDPLTCVAQHFEWTWDVVVSKAGS